MTENQPPWQRIRARRSRRPTCRISSAYTVEPTGSAPAVLLPSSGPSLSLAGATTLSQPGALISGWTSSSSQASSVGLSHVLFAATAERQTLQQQPKPTVAGLTTRPGC